MIFAIQIDKDGLFFSQCRNTYEEALQCAKENVSEYGELGIYTYRYDGETVLIETIKA